ncbi:MAG: heavy metal translocating P-type ATPase [Rubrivivax sp.]
MNAAATPSADTGHLDDPLELARYSRWVVDADGRRLADSSLQLSGMTCAACAGLIRHALLDVDGVRQVDVSAASQRARVRWDPECTRASTLVAAVRSAGYDAAPDAAAPARALRLAEQRRAIWRLFVAGICMMQVMMLVTPSYVAGPGELAPDLRQLLNWGAWLLTLPVVLFSAGPFFGGAVRALRQRRIAMDVPVAFGIGLAFVASTAATFDPGGLFGAETYFDSVTMFVTFLLAARLFEVRARHRAQQDIEATTAALPPAAWRETVDGGTECISVQRLRPGDVVRVPHGEAFPADGRLIEGRAQADESLLTGEAAAVDKAAGDELVAGSVNRGAPVRMRVERVGADTRFEAIVAMMRDALTQRPAAARLADRIAAPFLWTVLLLAAGSAAVWSLIDPARAPAVAVAVLIVTCPCALSLAAPAALVAAAGGLARRGVLLQRLDALEPLARLQHLFVDKTGTLTEAPVGAVGVRVAPEALLDASDALATAAALARWSTHPVARAIAAASPSVPSASALHDVEELAGRGMTGRDGAGHHWSLGGAGDAALPDWARGARSVLRRDDALVAAFDTDERLRAGAVAALVALRAEGVELTLLSGDNAPRVQALAHQLGLAPTQTIAGARPADKLAALVAAQRGGTVVGMVGDGVNDAPVLARADVSLAMGQGALIARAQADAVIVSGDWADFDRARSTARRTLAIVRQNLAWAAGYNLVALPLAMSGWLPPWAAGLGMALSSLLVVANAARAARAPPRRLGPAHTPLLPAQRA